MTTIDISPKAVELIVAACRSAPWTVKVDDAADMILALSAALTKSRAETAEATRCALMRRERLDLLEAAMTQSRAETAAAYERAAQEADRIENSHLAANIRALATPGQTTALTAVVRDAVQDALECARAQDEQGLGEGLLITSLAHCIAVSDAEARGMRKAAAIAKWVAGGACDTPDEMRGAAMVECAIFAAIPKGGDA